MLATSRGVRDRMEAGLSDRRVEAKRGSTLLPRSVTGTQGLYTVVLAVSRDELWLLLQRGPSE